MNKHTQSVSQPTGWGTPPPDSTRRILAYTRVSTEGQAEDGNSLEIQLGRIHAYARAHGYRVVGVYQDGGASGKSLDRTELQKALKQLKAREADGLAVLCLDRLSRSTRDTLSLVDCSDKEGWTLHSITENWDTSTPHGRFVVTILSGMAQMEREQTAYRTRLALGELRNHGKRISGRPPIGYRFGADGCLEVVKSEQPVLEALVELMRQGLGARRIAHALNDRFKEHSRTGKPWNPSTVAGIVRRLGRAG